MSLRGPRLVMLLLAFTLVWTQDGSSREEVVKRCSRDFEQGETISIWPTEGMPYTESPTLVRVLLGAMIVISGSIGVLFLRLAGRMRR